MFDETPTEPITTQQRQISEELMASMTSKIETALDADKVEVKDVFGNYQHVSITVVSAMFADKKTVQRQRMVYKVRLGSAVRQLRKVHMCDLQHTPNLQQPTFTKLCRRSGKSSKTQSMQLMR